MFKWVGYFGAIPFRKNENETGLCAAWSCGLRPKKKGLTAPIPCPKIAVHLYNLIFNLFKAPKKCGKKKDATQSRLTILLI